MTVFLWWSVACKCDWACRSSYVLSTVCLIHYYLHSNRRNTRDNVPDRFDKMFRLISMQISLYICLHFHGDFHHFHLSLQQYYINGPLSGSLMLGCATSSLLRRPLQWEICQIVILWRAGGSCSHALHGRTCEKTPCPAMFCKSKELRQLHEYQSGLSAFLWGLLVAIWMSQGFRGEKHLQVLPYLSNTCKVKVDWNINKQL